MVYGEEEMKKLTWKIWLLIIILAFSLLSIFSLPPTFLEKGVLITSVETNSTAFEQGLRQGQIITNIDNTPIENLEGFSNALKEKFNSNENIKLIIQTRNSEAILFSNHVPNITVVEIPKTNIKTGLDLAGGSRAMVQAEDKKLSSVEMDDLVDITRNRFDEFGLSDINVLRVSDLTGNHFMLVEVAGATRTDLKVLISEQGKFEAKIGNETVFIGGERDIASVARSGQDSYVGKPSQLQDGTYTATFRFTIFLSEEAAKRHAEITKDLEVNVTAQGSYLSENLDLFLDDNLVDTLLIGEGLKEE